MDPSRRSTRHLEAKNTPTRSPMDDTFRPLTNDSGRGSTSVTGRTSASESVTSNGASSSLSRDTPLDDDHNSINTNQQRNKPVRIRPTPVLEGKCYEQAYVSHVDHPSAFFIQLAHFEVHEFYSTNPRNNPSEWKRGDYCIAKFSDDDNFYRARIIEVPKGPRPIRSYDVVFIDYGNWEVVNVADIHILLPEFASLPAQAIACSLNKSLPKGDIWDDDLAATEFFKELVLNKHVDAIIQRKTSSDYWPLKFVDLKLSTTKLDIRDTMKNYIQETSNKEIYIRFNHYLTRQDYIIYNIPHEDDDNAADDDDDDDYY
ncbi:hypothetical protein I4U23_001730 [Adineta vaga]|nr:hypothetical protein I4U23_001730 [Adineta vaga]